MKIDELDDYWQENGAAPPPPPATHRPPAEDAPAAAAYREVLVRETPEERRARIERQRPEREAALAKIRALSAQFTMPGSDDNARREVPRIADPGQGERVRRQMAELRRRGEYDGPVETA